MSDHDRTFSAVILSAIIVLFFTLCLGMHTCVTLRSAERTADWHYENVTKQLNRLEHKVRNCRVDY